MRRLLKAYPQDDLHRWARITAFYRDISLSMLVIRLLEAERLKETQGNARKQR